MKKKSSVSLGPGASSLILIFVVLSMAVLGMFSLMTSRNDLRLSERSIQVTEGIYNLNQAAEERRALIDSVLIQCRENAGSENEYRKAGENALPDDVSMEDNLIVWMETDGSRALDCALELCPLQSTGRTKWVRYDLTAETEDTWNW